MQDHPIGNTLTNNLFFICAVRQNTFYKNLNMKGIMKGIKMWYARCFKVISREQAIEWRLTYQRGIFGDEINYLNCRSIWTDKKGRIYRVWSI
jgi:hypothetical protein